MEVKLKNLNRRMTKPKKLKFRKTLVIIWQMIMSSISLKCHTDVLDIAYSSRGDPAFATLILVLY